MGELVVTLLIILGLLLITTIPFLYLFWMMSKILLDALAEFIGAWLDLDDEDKKELFAPFTGADQRVDENHIVTEYGYVFEKAEVESYMEEFGTDWDEAVLEIESDRQVWEFLGVPWLWGGGARTPGHHNYRGNQDEK